MSDKHSGLHAMAGQSVVDAAGRAGGTAVDVGMIDSKHLHRNLFMIRLHLLANGQIILRIGPKIFARLAAVLNTTV